MRRPSVVTFLLTQTVLRRNLNIRCSLTDLDDVYTITVESTNGFPESGVFIESEVSNIPPRPRTSSWVVPVVTLV